MPQIETVHEIFGWWMLFVFIRCKIKDRNEINL